MCRGSTCVVFWLSSLCLSLVSPYSQRMGRTKSAELEMLFSRNPRNVTGEHGCSAPRASRRPPNQQISRPSDTHQGACLLASVRPQAEAATAAWAATMFDKVVTHSQFVRALLSDAAAPPPLPSRVAAVSFPLSSLLAVLPPPSTLAMYASGDESTRDEAAASRTRSGEAAGGGGGGGEGGSDSSGEARQLKTELVWLLRTLLRVHAQGSSAKPADDEEGTKGLEAGDRGDGGGGRWRPDETGRLMAVLLAAYGATCSAADRATLGLLRALDERKAAGGAGLDELRRLWGAAAASCVLSAAGAAGVCAMPLLRPSLRLLPAP